MIRNPNFHIQVRKRKWKAVLFLLRKLVDKVEEFQNQNLTSLGGLGTDEESESSKSEFSEKDGGDKPPEDDCCPICFDTFTIPCKTNCGHWFCANCILRFWTYRTALQKCNCPICTRPISKLTPEASLLIMREVEVVEVLKNVQKYNRLFQGGVNGVIRKFFEVPNVFKRMLCGLMDPDRFRGNYYAMRSFAQPPPPRSRTLIALHDAMLEDVCHPAEIVGKRVRYRLDGSKIIKIYLDPKARNDTEYKLETFSGVYRKLSGKDVVFEYPMTEA
ncbi:Zinc finger, RING/FYVE/PHD-type [Artemisia annua]|uniref:Zinc finger, RING/FYVE/PHD-type n=1 Tax=Artemisia annua TaxID=35608 RepID=A0A2U1MDC5_ARTAN|nr:Zinc finger, RING/FYVE/PHD-type [Artemisia annua]